MVEIEGRRRVSYQQIEMLLPGLTDSGRRSLITVLADRDLIFSDRLEHRLSLSISQYGRTQLEAEFPVLTLAEHPWQGEWCLLLFLQAPKNDPGYRYLRPALLEENFFSLTRGVYLHPGRPGQALIKLLEKEYQGAVTIVQFDNFQFGDELKIIGQKIDLTTTRDTYSEIGKDLNDLLTKKMVCKRLSDQRKQQISSVYDRLVTALESDHGLVQHYFPQATTGCDLLAKLQQSIV